MFRQIRLHGINTLDKCAIKGAISFITINKYFKPIQKIIYSQQHFYTILFSPREWDSVVLCCSVLDKDTRLRANLKKYGALSRIVVSPYCATTCRHSLNRCKHMKLVRMMYHGCTSRNRNVATNHSTNATLHDDNT